MRQGTLPRISALVARSDPGFGLRVVCVGVYVTLGLAVAGAVYAGLTWDQPNRWVLVLISVAAVCDAILIYVFRADFARSPHLDMIFAIWNASHIVAGGVAAVADGGVTSPYVTVMFVSIAFAAVSLPRLYMVAIAAIDVATVLAVATIEDTWPASLIFLVPSLMAVAFVCTAIAGERYRRLLAIEEARSETMQRLARVIEFRDLATATHVERMSGIAALIAERLGWSAGDVARLRAAAAMHDIGKVAVPDAILRKPGPLTADERRTIEHHTVAGWEMLFGSTSAELELAAEIALTHHERFDGRGYPNGLAGETIPIAGRIVAVADVFDALTSDRVYRPALPLDEALQIMSDGRGTQFDPTVLEAFEDALEEILAAREHEETVQSVPYFAPVAARDSLVS